jgi:hypothetical protein
MARPRGRGIEGGFVQRVALLPMRGGAGVGVAGAVRGGPRVGGAASASLSGGC